MNERHFIIRGTTSTLYYLKLKFKQTTQGEKILTKHFNIFIFLAHMKTTAEKCMRNFKLARIWRTSDIRYLN
jgi:hypothetical protein